MQYQPRPRKRFTQARALMLALVGVALLMGAIGAYQDGRLDWRGLLSNLGTELLGAVITYFIIDQVISNQENKQLLKDQLIRDMGNRDNGIASRAVAELRVHGWLQDGSLNGWFLNGANLEGVYLRDANLKGLGLYKTNLKGTKVDEHQLMALNDLRLTTLPNGALYDGRYCLPGDLNWAAERYHIDLPSAPPEALADYYGVALADYLAGVEWARTHLPPERLPDFLKDKV